MENKFTHNDTAHVAMDGGGKILTVKHEISDDGKTYELFMDGVVNNDQPK